MKSEAKRHHLEQRHGLYAQLVRPGELEPYEYWIRGMDGVTEIWRLISGRGLEAIFEQV